MNDGMGWDGVGGREGKGSNENKQNERKEKEIHTSIWCTYKYIWVEFLRLAIT
jgi:hypothetical protein